MKYRSYICVSRIIRNKENDARAFYSQVRTRRRRLQSIPREPTHSRYRLDLEGVRQDPDGAWATKTGRRPLHVEHRSKAARPLLLQPARGAGGALRLEHRLPAPDCKGMPPQKCHIK